jgi:hypothetical protein
MVRNIQYRLLTEKLKQEPHFKQSSYYPCIVMRNAGCLIIIYTEDTIITGSNTAKVDATAASIACLLNITSEDQVDDFIGINITHTDDLAHPTQADP